MYDFYELSLLALEKMLVLHLRSRPNSQAVKMYKNYLKCKRGEKQIIKLRWS